MNSPTPPALTFDDVAQAIGDTDPASTNASKLRAALGRGSFATIQRHLDTIRAQRVAALQAPADAAAVPAMPQELAALWGAAYAVAAVSVRTRLDAVVQERDALAKALQAAHGDVQALTAEMETMAGHADQAGQALAKATAAHDLAAGQWAAQSEKLAAQHAQELAGVVAQLEAAQHQAQLAQLESRIGGQALQATIDRLTDQLADVKSLLMRPVA
ncbi:MAG: DNA-binding protein [Polaromonas sp.]